MVELFRPKNCLVVVLGEIYGSELVIVRFSPVVACWPAQKQTHRQRNVSGGFVVNNEWENGLLGSRTVTRGGAAPTRKMFAPWKNVLLDLV